MIVIKNETGYRKQSRSLYWAVNIFISAVKFVSLLETASSGHERNCSFFKAKNKTISVPRLKKLGQTKQYIYSWKKKRWFGFITGCVSSYVPGF